MASQNGSNPQAGAQPTSITAAAQAAAQRRAERQEALEAAIAAVDGDSNDREHDALVAMIEAFSPRSRASGGPRVVLDKADPKDVAAYFASTELTRKELAAAAGVSTSVIATVQNEKGDRWSTKTFEAKRQAIDAWMVEHKAEIDGRKANEAAEAAKRKAEADAKAQRVLARQQAASAKAAAPKAKAAPKAATAKAAPAKASASAAKKPGRPSQSARQANRKAAPVAVQA